MCRTLMVVFRLLVSEIWSFDSFYAILCNLNCCAPHNSHTVHDMFMQCTMFIFFCNFHFICFILFEQTYIVNQLTVMCTTQVERSARIQKFSSKGRERGRIHAT